MYVGLDISKKETVCVGTDKEGRVLFEETFPTSAEGIDRLMGAVGRKSKFVLEASTHGIFVYDCLTSLGADVIVANPAKLRILYDSEKKTDREDAQKLVDLLRTNRVPECHVPDKNCREIRDMIRQRRSIVEMRVTAKNKIRSILARDGVEIEQTNILGVDALYELENVTLSSPVQKDALDRLVHIAGTLSSNIADYDGKIIERYKKSNEAQILDTIPGISYYSAVHISSAIDDIKRFSSDQELACYAGLVPQTYQSGEKRVDGRLMRGDKLLRWILIQNANAAIRCSKRFRKYYLRKKRKRGHQKAIISVARKVIGIIYLMLTRGETYSENYGK